MGGTMSSVVPGVYIGGLSSARSEKQLDECNITHVCTAFQYPISIDSKRVHKQFVLRDSPEENISRFFIDSADFIHGARVTNGTVLIHCACGISRSVSLVIAYLTTVTDFTVRDVYKAVRAARLVACPNTGFLRQLLRFEEHADHLRAREFLTMKYGPWSEDRRASDTTEIRRLIDIQDEFIATGYYPWDERPPPDNEGVDGGRKRPVRFTCRLPDSAATLDGALHTETSEQTTSPENANAADGT